MIRKKIVGGIILLFLFSSLIPNIYGIPEKSKNILDLEKINQEEGLITSLIIDLDNNPIYESNNKSKDVAINLINKIKKLEDEIAINPKSQTTKKLHDELIEYAKNYDLIPEDFSLKKIQEGIINEYSSMKIQFLNPKKTSIYASEWFCNFASTGEGSSLPIIILPRIIPIIVTPIPRIFMRWQADNGITSCGGLLSGTGFIAYGEQRGYALGFWGIGFSIFLPPIRSYGLFGYALYTSVNSETLPRSRADRPGRTGAP